MRRARARSRARGRRRSGVLATWAAAIIAAARMNAFDFAPRTRLVFGAGSLSRLGELAHELGFRRCLLVSDAGLVQAGIVGRAAASLRAASIEVVTFHDFDSNPDALMVERGVALARRERIDSLVGLGGGSSMD